MTNFTVNRKTEKCLKSSYGFGGHLISLNLKLAPVPYATPKWPLIIVVVKF